MHKTVKLTNDIHLPNAPAIIPFTTGACLNLGLFILPRNEKKSDWA
jgi:hypothetical protein